MLPPVTDTEACRPWLGRTDDKGYGFIKVNGRTTRVHRVAWAMAHGEWPPEGQVVRHTCDNPPCCNDRHLILGTPRENVADCVSRGRRARGEHTGGAVLTAELVRDVRARLRDGATQREVAEAIGVTAACIGRVARRETWAHVDEAAVPQTHRAALDRVAWPAGLTS